MKTFSELQDLAKSLVRRVHNSNPTTGAVVIAWNRGADRTPAAMYAHAGKGEEKVIVHMLRSMADQIEASESAESQGMFLTPSGLLVPKS